MAIGEFEKSNPGLKVSYKIEDSAYSNTRTVSGFHKLTSIDGVSAIIGTTWETFSTIIPLCESKKIVCISTSYRGSEFENPKFQLKYSFTIWPRDADYGTTIGRGLNDRDISRVAVIASNSTVYYDLLVDEFLSTYRNKPIEVIRVPGDTQDYRSILTKLPPDLQAMVVLVDPGQSLSLLKQWLEIKKTKPIIFSDDGAILLSPMVDKIKSLGFEIFYAYPKISDEIEKPWNARYVVQFKETPPASSAIITYDETLIALHCLALRARDGKQDVRECIAHTKSFPGVAGTLAFAGRQTATRGTFTIEKLGTEPS